MRSSTVAVLFMMVQLVRVTELLLYITPPLPVAVISKKSLLVTMITRALAWLWIALLQL